MRTHSVTEPVEVSRHPSGYRVQIGCGASAVQAKSQELIDVLQKLILLLQSDGGSCWIEWLDRAQSMLKADNPEGATYLLSAYGGMGSFNDLVLGQVYENGVSTSWKSNADQLNEEYFRLKNIAWKLAQAIQEGQ
jgi:hypothetical protein